MGVKQDSAGPAHHPGAGKGNEPGDKEPGRQDGGVSEKGREKGKATARQSTSINPKREESITPGSVEMPPA